MVIDDTGSVEESVTDASLTHSLTTLKDSATQLLIKYKSGALVTQKVLRNKSDQLRSSSVH